MRRNKKINTKKKEGKLSEVQPNIKSLKLANTIMEFIEIKQYFLYKISSVWMFLPYTAVNISRAETQATPQVISCLQCNGRNVYLKFA